MFRLLLITTTFCAATAAQAELRVCNETDAKASVAIGYNDGGVWTSEGWWNIPPYDCSVVQGGDLTKKYYYYRVTSERYSWPGERYFFCTSQSAFTIAGDEDCAARGYDQSEFRQIEVGGLTSYTLNLTAAASAPPPPPPPEPSPARTDPPGTHGEPYTISGILSHCDFYDVSMACEIHANGFRYVANSSGPTPQTLLEEMADLGENRPVSISGDMIFYEGNVAEVTIRDYEATGTDPYAAYRAGMQGFWRSMDDPNFEVLIYGSVYEEMYQQISTSTSTMFFTQRCEDSPGSGPAFELVPYGETEADRCMFILNTGQTLELHPAGVMNDLRFFKVN
ncbi:DUF1036 domain-containing protein [Shimia sp. SDUM112013]|uniref:DUF1036 domain-containing protein n=1 Tax=Shimia sp. SDUM112013 TaxID=3136160 RepID=UPI0032F055B1